VPQLGYDPIYGNTLGNPGSPTFFGPLEAMVRFLGILSSEFYAKWIRNQL
jgi:hypothetical protein